MNDIKLKLFNNNDFGSIRIIDINGEPWFVGKDVAEALGYVDTKSAIRDHVSVEDKEVIQRGQITTLEIPNRGLMIINESGLYSLILGSKLSNAKKFKRWVTSEVLPSIHRTGNYISDKERLQLQLFSDDKLVVVHAHKELIEMEKAPLLAQLEEQAPDVAFARAIGDSETLIYISELAKILKQNGVDMGERRLFDWLRDHGYLIKRKGQTRNLPTQRSIDLGILKIVEKPYDKPNGEKLIGRTAMVTPKGQRYFLDKFLALAVKGA